jgi:hypothetical protein
MATAKKTNPELTKHIPHQRRLLRLRVERAELENKEARGKVIKPGDLQRQLALIVGAIEGVIAASKLLPAEKADLRGDIRTISKVH